MEKILVRAASLTENKCFKVKFELKVTDFDNYRGNIPFCQIYTIKIWSICNIIYFFFFIKGTDDQKWMSKLIQIVQKPFLIDWKRLTRNSSVQTWLMRWKFDKFATFSIFGLFFIKGSNDQGSYWNHFESICSRKNG